MTKQEYIQLTKQPLKLLYTHYKETNQDKLGSTIKLHEKICVFRCNRRLPIVIKL